MTQELTSRQDIIHSLTNQIQSLTQQTESAVHDADVKCIELQRNIDNQSAVIASLDRELTAAKRTIDEVKSESMYRYRRQCRIAIVEYLRLVSREIIFYLHVLSVYVSILIATIFMHKFGVIARNIILFDNWALSELLIFDCHDSLTYQPGKKTLEARLEEQRKLLTEEASMHQVWYCVVRAVLRLYLIIFT